MFRITLFLLSASILGLLVPPTSSAQAPTAAASATPRRTRGLPAENSPAAQRWVRQQVRLARQGHASLLELPVGRRGEWGCSCPLEYVGTDTLGQGAEWIKIRVEDSLQLPPAGGEGGIHLVRGYFSGAIERVAGPDPSGRWYVIYEFVVTQVVRRNIQNEDTQAQMRIVRSNAFSCTSTVQDETPLHVRVRPTLQSTVAQDLVNGTQVIVAEVRPEWLKLSAPAVGWVWAENVASTCSENAE